jgi:membrane protease YdiL (CAAX protease family)
VSEFLDGALYFQIIGYLLAVGLAIHMVRKVQGGDWSTLGIRWDGSQRHEVLGGALFGVLMLAAFMPISLVLTGGELKVDELMRMLVGSTSGLGLVLAAVVVVIGAPIIEEIYYRGLLYEKLARKRVWVALVVTTVLFTAAHGALLIPAILILGFGLAWQRRTKSLWYTMGAHAAWNLCVLALGLFLLVGGWDFTPPDGAYTIRFPKAWERAEIPVGVGGPATFDVGVTTSSGSLVSVMRMPAVDGSATATMEQLMKEMAKSPLGTAPRMGPEGHDHLFDHNAESSRVVYGINDNGTEVAVNFFVLVRPDSPTALVLNFICPKVSCADDGAKFDEAMHALKFAY